jgi:hypothetical protein
VGIGKIVLMRPLDFYPLSRTRYDVMALTAKYIFLFIRRLLFCFILNNTARHFIALFFMRQTKKAFGTRINCFNCYHPLPSDRLGNFDGFVKSPTSALRFISLSLRCTLSTRPSAPALADYTKFARLEFGAFYFAIAILTGLLPASPAL